MQMQLAELIDKKLNGALSLMAQADARTPALQLLWLAQSEAIRRGLLVADVDGSHLMPSTRREGREDSTHEK